MKIGIMQPYFFPYLGYFSLIKATDLWIVFDEVQYIRHGWINRNRIIKPDFKDVQYVNVPLVKHKRSTLIKDILIKNNEEWQSKIINQLNHYKKKAPYFFEVKNLVEQCFSQKFDDIVNLNAFALQNVCEYLNINFDYKIYSELEMKLDEQNMNAGDWALEISKDLNAQTYINPAGGREIFSKVKFEENNVELKFLSNKLTSYNQIGANQFFEGLSIIDVLMFNSKEETIALINNFEINE